MLARQDLIPLKLLKTRKNVGMFLNGCIDSRKTNPTIHILKLWHRVCLPTLLYGAELWTLNSSLRFWPI